MKAGSSINTLYISDLNLLKVIKITVYIYSFDNKQISCIKKSGILFAALDLNIVDKNSKNKSSFICDHDYAISHFYCFDICLRLLIFTFIF